MPEYAATLRLIVAKGPGVLYGGDLGATVADYMRRHGGIITLEDLARYETIERQPIRGRYRGFEVTGAPPPTAGGLHLIEMLNILEGFDPRGLGFGTAEYFHLIAEVLKIGFADRNACTGDPAFVDIPVERLTSKEYAASRRAQIRPERAGDYGASTGGVVPDVAAGSAHTTHVTTADADGNVVAMTQTINNLFGSKATVPGTGVLLNNTMALFDPHPGTPASIAPGKRVTSSMAPTIVLRDGEPVWALGLPGGVRIFTSVFQAMVNLIDHGMTLQEAVEAPRIWSQGQELEMEQDIPAAIRDAVAARGHRVVAFAAVAGGMNAVAFAADGTLEGAACWRADGTPIGVSGGLARPGVRFRPDANRRAT
jgi:gamma-glutamyltranspeptidase/glutathione hydrolase